MKPVEAKGRASFYAFLALHFLNLPDESFVSGLRHRSFRAVLKELTFGIDVHPEIAEGANRMRSYLEHAKSLDAAALSRQLGLDRTRLYRGASSQKGPIPPYEALWTMPDRTEAALQGIAAVYSRSGFTLNGSVNERPDYIGIELDFMEKLAWDEVSAMESGQAEKVQETLGLETEFFCSHLVQWAPRFAASALGFADTDFYKGHIYMLKGFLEQERETLKCFS